MKKNTFQNFEKKQRHWWTGDNEWWWNRKYWFLCYCAFGEKNKEIKLGFQKSVFLVYYYSCILTTKYVGSTKKPGFWKCKLNKTFKKAQLATHFSSYFENCFESVVLPEKISGSTTDYENYFSQSVDWIFWFSTNLI